MKINNELIIKKAKELEDFDGYLPKFIAFYIDTEKWEENLKSKGLWEKVELIIEDARHNSFDDDLNVLIEWVNKNPKYSDFIIE